MTTSWEIEGKPVGPAHANTVDLTGQPFGRWTVLGFAGRRGRRLLWRCRCECGSLGEIYGCNLRAGKSVSCGCFRDERTRETQTTHGKRNAPEYLNWTLMRRRCFDKRCAEYERYGKAGITVDPSWLGRNGFATFLAFMGPRPTPTHTLDRYPSQRGNYEPGNVRWATPIEQGNNKTNNRLIAHDGVVRTLEEWARFRKVPSGRILQRLDRGWSFADAIGRPPRVMQHRSPMGAGEVASLLALADRIGPTAASAETGVSRTTIRKLRAKASPQIAANDLAKETG